MPRKIYTVIGAGSGISLATARRFAEEGYTLALISRNEEKLQQYVSQLSRSKQGAFYFVGDAGNPESLRNAFEKIKEQLGDTDVLHYNAAKVKKADILSEKAESIAEDFMVNVGGALEAVKAVLPQMQAQNYGTLLFTGGGFALFPNPDYGSLGIGKAGIRNLAQQLAVRLKDTGIKVGTVTVTGYVTPDSERYNPDAIAEQFWKLHVDLSSNWEIVY